MSAMANVRVRLERAPLTLRPALPAQIPPADTTAPVTPGVSPASTASSNTCWRLATRSGGSCLSVGSGKAGSVGPPVAADGPPAVWSSGSDRGPGRLVSFPGLQAQTVSRTLVTPMTIDRTGVNTAVVLRPRGCAVPSPCSGSRGPARPSVSPARRPVSASQALGRQPADDLGQPVGAGPALLVAASTGRGRSASAVPDTSNGLTSSASSPNSSATPASVESTTAQPFSDSTGTSLATRFIPSRTGLTSSTSPNR